MRDFLFELVAFALLYCIPANVQTMARPFRVLLKKALVWLWDSVVIWARAVRRDLES